MYMVATLALVASVNAEVTSASDCQNDYYGVLTNFDVPLSTAQKCEALVVFSKCLGQFPADDAKEQVLFEKNSEVCAPYWDNVEAPSVRTARDNMQLSVDNAKEIEFFRHRRQSISVFKMDEKITGLLDTVDVLKQQLVDQKQESEDRAAATAKDLQDLEKKLSDAEEALEDSVDDLSDKVDQAKSDTTAALNQAKSDTDAALEKSKKDATATNVVLKKSLTDAVDEKLKPIAGAEKAIAALKTTRYNNPKIPVFRVAVWSTYSQASSWLDGNRPNGFGGNHPSGWSDGSDRA